MVEDPLCSVLAAARPDWSERDCLSALSRLHQVDVRTPQQLARSLQGGELTKRLRDKKLKEFKRETLAELRLQLMSTPRTQRREQVEPECEPQVWALPTLPTTPAGDESYSGRMLAAELASIGDEHPAAPEPVYMTRDRGVRVRTPTPMSAVTSDPFAKDRDEVPGFRPVDSKVFARPARDDPAEGVATRRKPADAVDGDDDDDGAIPDYSTLLRELDSAADVDKEKQRGHEEGIPVGDLESHEALRELLECFEHIEHAPRSELQEECSRMELAACSTAPREELRRAIREGLIWQQLSLPALRSLCQERGVPCVERQTRTTLLQRLSERSWEGMGVPLKRFKTSWEAQKALDDIWRLRQEAAKTPQRLSEHAAKHVLPAGLRQELLLQWLEKIAVWNRLSATELRRECIERGLADAGKDTPCTTEEAWKLRTQLVCALRRERCEAAGIAPESVCGLDAAESILADFEAWCEMDLEALKAEAKRRDMPLPNFKSETEEGHQLILRHVKEALVWDRLPLDTLRQECKKHHVTFPKVYFAGGVPEELFIVGSWQNFTPQRMQKQGRRFNHTFVSEAGNDCFQLMLEEGKWSSVLHPNIKEANPWREHSILGPDDQGKCFDWQIGNHKEDAALGQPGAKCVVVVSFEEDPPSVSWAEDQGLLSPKLPAPQFSYRGLPRRQASAEPARKQAMRELLTHEAHLTELEADGVPVRLLEGDSLAETQGDVRQQCMEVDKMSKSELVEWYKDVGFPMERSLQREEMARFFKRYFCWQALPLDLLHQECKRLGVEVAVATEPQVLLRRLQDHDRLEAWERRGYEARRIGDVDAVMSIVDEYEALLSKSDWDLQQLCMKLALPREEVNVPRDELLRTLQALMVWASLPEAKLRTFCEEKGLPTKDVSEADLLRILRVHTFQDTYEARGLPVTRLGYLRTFEVANELEALEGLSDEELQKIYEGDKKLLPPGLSRQMWLAFVRDLTLWEALPIEELWKECEARHVPMDGFELTDEKIQQRLLDRLILREHIVEANMRICKRQGPLQAGADGILPQEWPEAWAMVRQLRDPFVSEYFCGVAAKPLPLGSRLPREARSWGPLEAALYTLSRGTFNPGAVTPTFPEDGDKQPLVSVVCPTSSERRVYHKLLYECFRTQDYSNKELIVVDSGDEPSSFLSQLTDSRVTYRFFDIEDLREGKVHQKVAWSLGLKRNVGCYLARGAAIAHFDDDDLYGRGYLSHMIDMLKDAACDSSLRRPAAAKLTEWYIRDTDTNRWRFLDVANEAVPAQQRRDWLYGWGFSYVFTRSAWQLSPFPDVEFAEDAGFIEGLIARGVPVKLARLPVGQNGDADGLVAHSFHAGSTSGGELDGSKRAGKGVISMPNAFVDLMRTVIEIEQMKRDIGAAGGHRAVHRQGWTIPPGVAGRKTQPSVRVKKPVQQGGPRQQDYGFKAFGIGQPSILGSLQSTQLRPRGAAK